MTDEKPVSLIWEAHDLVNEIEDRPTTWQDVDHRMKVTRCLEQLADALEAAQRGDARPATCRAGDLGTAAVGHLVNVELANGDRIADKLQSVQHTTRGDARATRVTFVNIPNPGVLFSTSPGWDLDPSSEVTVY
jgi:hypothetical protein